MPAQIFGSQATAVQLYVAFFGVSPSNPIYTNYTSTISTSSASSLAAQISASFAATSDATLAANVLTNIGITVASTNQVAYDALLSALTQVFTAYGTANRGQIVLNLVTILTTLEGNATYGAAATAWNTTTLNAYTYASNTANTTPGSTSPAVVISNFTLTASTDSLSGSTGNDTFVAGTQNGNDTLNAGDNLSGGAGTDTLNIFAGGANFGVATVTGIEVVNVYQDIAFDVSGNVGVTQVNSIGGASKTITGTVAQTIGFGNLTTGGAAVATFTSVAGAADAATISLNDAGKTTAYTSLTVAGIETLTVNLTGANQVTTLTAVNAAKVNITGAGSLTTALSNTAAYKTIDGSTATGALSIDASGATASAQVLDIKTGTGGDTYTTLYANMTTADKIDLGAGTDTLAFADATVLTSAAAVAVLAGVTNVETLRVNGTAAFTVDADLVSQTNFRHQSTGAFTGTNFSTTDKLIIGAVNIADSTVAMKLGQNTLAVDLAGSATAAVDGSNLTVTGASTVNVNSTGTAGVANNSLVLVTDSNGTVNLTGSQNTTLAASIPSGTTGLSIVASTFTGKATITGTAQGDAITGGTGDDTITGGDGTDTVTGGAGVDTFAFAVGDNAGADGAAVADIITGFVAGTDKLQFTAFVDVVSGQQAAVQAAVTALASTATAAQIATAMANANTTDLGVSFAVFGGNTYVYAETTGATTTHVEAANIFIQLAGVTTAPTFAADVVA
jgi:hypothetical protein